MADTQTVVVGYLHGPQITQEFHHSLFGLHIYDREGPQRILDYVPQYSGANVCKSRNQMVHDFLATTGEWLMMFDSDAAFRPTIVDALLDAADVDEAPIVGGLAHQYRGRTDPDTFEPVFGPDGLQKRELLPTMYKTEWGPDGEWVGYREITAYHAGAMHEVDATGCHALLAHRTVFEAIRSDHPYRWFREDEISPGVIAGEDIWFCMEARKAGKRIWVHTGVETGHIKPVVLTHEMSHVERIT